MSFKKTAWAIQSKPENGTQKMVLIIICDAIQDKTGVCWPSIDHIAELAMVSPRTVQRAIKALSDQGFLKADEMVGRSNIYRVNTSVTPDMGVTPVITDTPDTSVTPDTVPPLTPMSGGGDMGVVGGCHDIPAEPHKQGDEHLNLEGTYKESINPKDEGEPGKLKIVKSGVPLGVEPELWHEFISIRKTLKAVNSDLAITKLTKKLERFRDAGYDINEIIETSVVSSWKDVYKPRKEISNGNSQRNHQPTATELLLNMDW